MDWNQIANYIDTAALTVIVILFARGLIVSRFTVDKIEKNFKAFLDKMCASFTRQAEEQNRSFREELETIKEVFGILKKKNGIK